MTLTWLTTEPVAVVVSNARQVLYDGPPANSLDAQGRRQANGVITASLPNGDSSIETTVTSGSGAVVGTSTVTVVVEGIFTCHGYWAV